MHSAHRSQKEARFRNPETKQKSLYLIFIAIDESDFIENVKNQYWQLFMCLALWLMMMLVIGYFIQRHTLLAPIKNAVNALHHQRKNNLPLRLNIQSKNEIGELAQVFNDISKEMSQSQERLTQNQHNIESMTQHIPVLLVYLDREFRVQFVNQSLKTWFKIDSKEVLGHPITSIFDEKTQENLDFVLNQSLTGQQVDVTEKISTKTCVFYVNLTCTPDINTGGEVSGFFMCFEDVTQIRALNENLSSYANKLYLQAALLKEQTLKAEQATKEKSEFLATMSHEIRNPVNGVLGILQVLARTPLNARQIEYVNIANSSAKALLSIIHDILDFSRIEAGKLALDCVHFNLKELLEDCIQSMAYSAHKKDLELILDTTLITDEWYEGDPGRIRQIILNLIGNAIKFTQVGEVLLWVQTTTKNNLTEISIHCQDSGIGISQENVSKLFAPFNQGDSSTTRVFGGTGLGLTICKKLCEAMKGDIFIQSEVDVGSVFTVSLSLKSLNRPTEMINLEDFRVLILDKNEQHALTLKKQLIKCGVNQVDVALGLASSIRILKNTKIKYDCILMDTDLNSFACFGSLKNQKFSTIVKEALSSPEHPLVGMSKFGEEKDLEFGNDNDYHHIQSKPILMKNLHSLFKTSISQSPQNIVVDEKLFHSSSQESVLKDKKVLVVEDDLVNQAVIEGLLERFDVEFDFVENGSLAIEALKKNTYDIILMDCYMPVMDGFEATKHIRKGTAGSEYVNIPIIALTASSTHSTKQECLSLQMNDFIPKPFEHDNLISVMSKLL